MTSPWLLLALTTLTTISEDEPVGSPFPPFHRQVIDPDFPGAYQVEIAEVNGDGRPDVIALGGGTCAWYQNPDWRKHLITRPDQTPGIISSAAADLNGDGRAEIAIAYEFQMNLPTRGKLGLATQGPSPEDPWAFTHIADVPSIHRVRWQYPRHSGPPKLVAAPIFGPDSKPPTYTQDEANLWIFTLSDPSAPSPILSSINARTAIHRPVIHAIELVNEPDHCSNREFILTADNLGIGYLHHEPSGPPEGEFQPIVSLVPGASGEPPARGASEIRWGRLADRRRFLATIEPWHGNTVAIYPSSEPVQPEKPFLLSPYAPDQTLPLSIPMNTGSVRLPFGPRTVLDTGLDDGHALCVADINADGNDEVFAGHRGNNHGITGYILHHDQWIPMKLDPQIAAQDLRAADLNADGRPEIVAVGGKTRNVVLYRFQP